MKQKTGIESKKGKNAITQVKLN